ncbi:MAG: hypothetical protein J0I12_00190 [Candidatus Eremiobacteraeota bacterium]|nr:hypothetical protein [Candidatus Eremiobacteraeota bacterium]
MAEAAREGPVDELLRLRRVWPGSAADLFQMLEEQLAIRPRSSAVRLECSGGQTLHGQVVRYQAQSRTVLLAHQGTLSWVDLNQVVAVTLVHAESWLQELTRGQVRGPQEPAPTRLHLRRQAEQLAKHLHLTSFEIPWTKLPDDDQSSRHLQLLLKELDECWLEIGADEMGKKALTGIREMVLELSDYPEIALEEGRCYLRIAAGPEGLLAFPPGSLRKQLEKIL